MTSMSLREFADRVAEMMPFLAREIFRPESRELYNMKVSLPQFAILNFLNHHKEPKMSDMARFLNVSTAAITGIVGRLVRDGYVVRKSDPNDRRVIKIKLTTKGSGILNKIIDHKKNMVMRIFGMISQKERDEYFKILSHIKQNLDKERAS